MGFLLKISQVELNKIHRFRQLSAVLHQHYYTGVHLFGQRVHVHLAIHQ